MFSLNDRVLKLRFLAFPEGPGGFRELREASRKHFHLSWYLLVPGVTSYDQKVEEGTQDTDINKGLIEGIVLFWGTFFVKKNVWTQCLCPGT